MQCKWRDARAFVGCAAKVLFAFGTIVSMGVIVVWALLSLYFAALG